jgi:hypothetical protein
MALAGWLRLLQSLYQWQYLREYQMQPGPIYTLVTGFLLGLGLSAGLIGFWLRKAWSRKYLQFSIALAAAWWWLDYLFFTKNTAAFSNWPFRAAATLVVLGFLYGCLHLLARKSTEGKNEK